MAVDQFAAQKLILRTVYAPVFPAHDRRRFVHVNVTRHPTAQRIWQQFFEATPWGEQPRYLIGDRDHSYGKDCIGRAARLGIETVLTPLYAPNAVAERVIGTLHRERLHHSIVLNERRLPHALREYVKHQNGKRPHRSLALDSPPGDRLGQFRSQAGSSGGPFRRPAP